MEEYERHTLSHYPFKDEARKDVIRKLAKLSVLSDKYISEGNTKDATAYLQSYNTLMKELGIGNEIAANENSINSLSELVSYLEKKGFVLNYRINEDRDIVDKTLKNMEQYVRRLFNDSQETVNEMYNQKEISNESGTVIDDDDLEALYASDGEEKVELEEVLNELVNERKIDFIYDDRLMIKRESFQESGIKYLSKREYNVLLNRIKGITLEVIGEIYDISRERVICVSFI